MAPSSSLPLTKLQRRALKRVTAWGEFEAEITAGPRGAIFVVVGSSRQHFAITPRGRVDDLGRA